MPPRLVQKSPRAARSASRPPQRCSRHRIQRWWIVPGPGSSSPCAEARSTAAGKLQAPDSVFRPVDASWVSLDLKGCRPRELLLAPVVYVFHSRLFPGCSGAEASRRRTASGDNQFSRGRCVTLRCSTPQRTAGVHDTLLEVASDASPRGAGVRHRRPRIALLIPWTGQFPNGDGWSPRCGQGDRPRRPRHPCGRSRRRGVAAAPWSEISSSAWCPVSLPTLG